MAKTAYVTGGTGFVGINLVELLTKEDWKVTALHRPTSSLKYLSRFPVDLAQGTITDKASLERGLPEGTEVVFHVAGSVNFWSKRNPEQTAINVDGTRNMIEVAASKGVKTFIHTSSISAWGPALGHIEETTPQLGEHSWINYESSKWAGEKEVLKGKDKGMKVVIINPAGIAGPYDTSSWASIFFALKNNALPGIPSGDNSISHVQDIVKAHLAAVDHGRNGERYILGGQSVNMADLVGEMASLMNVKSPRALPTFLLKAAARITAFGASISGKEPDITPEMADITTRKGVSFTNKKAQEELGFRVRPWQEGIKDSHEWLVKEGRL